MSRSRSSVFKLWSFCITCLFFSIHRWRGKWRNLVPSYGTDKWRPVSRVICHRRHLCPTCPPVFLSPSTPSLIRHFWRLVINHVNHGYGRSLVFLLISSFFISQRYMANAIYNWKHDSFDQLSMIFFHISSFFFLVERLDTFDAIITGV